MAVSVSAGDKKPPPPPPPVHYFKTDGSAVSCLGFLEHHGAPLLAQGSQTGEVTVWDLARCESVWSVRAHPASCQAVLQLEDGRLVTHGRHQAVTVWDWPSGRAVCSVPVSHPGFCGATAASGGLLAVPAEPPGHVSLLEPRAAGREAARLPAPPELGAVMQLSPEPGSGRLAAVYEAGAVLLWDPARPGEPLSRLQLPGDAAEETPMCVSVDSGGRGLAGTAGRTLHTFSVTGDALLPGPGLALTNPGVSSCRGRRDGRLAALGCWDGRVRLVSGRRRPRLLAALQHHTGAVRCVQFAPRPVPLWRAQHLLASAGADGTVALWKVYDDA